MKKIQELYDACTDELVLDEPYYSGPLVMDRPCRIIGNGASIICAADEDVRIETSGCELADIRIERTAVSEGQGAVLQCPDGTILRNVRLRGDMLRGGVLTKASQFPDRLDLGEIPAGQKNTFRLSVTVPTDSVIVHDLSDVEITPNRLTAGENHITVSIGALRDKTSIFGRLLFMGDVGKEVLLTANASRSAVQSLTEDTILVDQLSSLAFSDALAERSVYIAPSELIPPRAEEASTTIMKRGQRLTLDPTQTQLKLQLISDGIERKMDIDGYAFMLHENGKTARDEDMIFWGNKASPDNAVKLIETGGISCFGIDIDMLPPEISRVAVCWSIYGDDPADCFVQVTSPQLRILIGNVEACLFPITGLCHEKTLTAAELYRHNGKWKINCIGSGYNAGLRRLCEDYGMEIAD